VVAATIWPQELKLEFTNVFLLFEKQLFYHFFIILASSKLSKKHHLYENNYHFLFFKVSKIIVLSLPSSRIIIS